MSAVTLEDLRHELQNFAENTIQSYLSDFSTAIRNSMSEDVQHIINTSFQAHNALGEIKPQNVQPQILRNAANSESNHLPGQLSQISLGHPTPVIDDAKDGRPEGKKVVFASTSGLEYDQIESNKMSNEHYETALASSMTNEYDAAKQKLSRFRAAVSTEPNMAQQLRSLGYFRKCSAWTEFSGDQGPVMSAKETMLRHGESSPNNDLLRTQSLPTEEDFDAVVDTNIISKVVRSDAFEHCVLFVVFANAIFIGIAIQTTSSDPSATLSSPMHIFEILFFVIFALEVLLRIFVYRCWFFNCRTPAGSHNPDFGWNITDLLIVGFQLLELILARAHSDVKFGKISVWRVCRMMRIARLIRVAKLVRLFRSLRVMASAMLSSLGMFVWGLTCLQVLTYVFAVYLTEIVNAHHDEHEDDAALKEHFGSLSRSWMSLLKAVSGGIDWGDLSTPLRKVGVVGGLVPFMVYLFFVLLALMNIFTGMFLEDASNRKRYETEIQLLQSAHTVFRASDGDDDDMISKDEFHESLQNADVHEFFEAINFDIQQAEILFELLDNSHDNRISFHEFLRGCLRLRGTAKALDLLILSREVHQLIDGLAEITKENSMMSNVNQNLINQLLITSQDNHRLLEDLLVQERKERKRTNK